MSIDRELERAYALRTPQDSVALYRDWAGTYDTGFAVTHAYILHQQVADAFREAGGQGPVLDIGAGTGLVGAALGDIEVDGIEVDAIDISQEMLDVAGSKGLYRRRICADLTRPLDIDDRAYAGFVSAGTFTHGHVGPGALPELMRIARPGALFVLSIKDDVFDGAGFGSAFARLVADGVIGPLSFRWVRNYREGADHDHAEDRGLLAVFARL